MTHRGKLIGVVALRELRGALANIYTRGAVPFVDHQISKKRSLPGIIESHPVHSKNGSTSNIGPLTQTTTADSSADNMKDSLRISRSNSTGRQLFESDSSSDDTENDNPFLETPNVLSED